ncbi:MAG: hypothetical protein ACRD3Q_13965, partial [Terriglobales bacterium]
RGLSDVGQTDDSDGETHKTKSLEGVGPRPQPAPICHYGRPGRLGAGRCPLGDQQTPTAAKTSVIRRVTGSFRLRGDVCSDPELSAVRLSIHPLTAPSRTRFA